MVVAGERLEAELEIVLDASYGIAASDRTPSPDDDSHSSEITYQLELVFSE